MVGFLVLVFSLSVCVSGEGGGGWGGGGGGGAVVQGRVWLLLAISFIFVAALLFSSVFPFSVGGLVWI